MKKNWLAVIAVAGIAVAIVSYKQWLQLPFAASQPLRGAAKDRLSLLLVADPREANESDGCGVIVRMVRAAAARGIPLREVTPDAAREIDSRYRIVVSPTVLVLENGNLLKRYQGESSETVASVRAQLRALEDQ